MQTKRLFFAVVLVAVLHSCGLALFGQEKVQTPTGTDEPAADLAREIGQQIEALSSNRFQVREAASNRLFEIGEAAFDPLLETANGQMLEAVDRAILVLQRSATDDNEDDVRLAALERLIHVKGRPGLVQRAHQAIYQLHKPQAIARLLANGAKILETGHDEHFSRDLPKRIRIDEAWQGGDSGLADLEFIDDVNLVHIKSAKVTADGITLLKKMPRLLQLHVHAVPLRKDELETLTGLYGNIIFSYKRGALLGVTGQLGATGAVIQLVRPATAAARADFQPGDQILKMNDQPIADFEELTDLIAKLDPGTKATFVLHRGDEKLEKEVTFGSW